MEDCIGTLIKRYPRLESCRTSIYKAYEQMKESFERGGKILVAGNGGSASDAEHIVGELMKCFNLQRKINVNLRDKLIAIDCEKGMELAEKLQMALPAISLCNHSSLNTAFLNDVDGRMCFAQQVHGYGVKGDILLVISTSGDSENILYAAITAKAEDIFVIGLTGKGGGKLASIADLMISVDETETYKVQELHLPIYHCFCMMLENYFFK
ncbi:MAG: SIS domain-containing protein [Lachnospiraceae bacterium]|nr:SIS domain-containing protein [Lachnospiraceae bacterium]